MLQFDTSFKMSIINTHGSVLRCSGKILLRPVPLLVRSTVAVAALLVAGTSYADTGGLHGNIVDVATSWRAGCTGAGGGGTGTGSGSGGTNLPSRMLSRVMSAEAVRARSAASVAREYCGNICCSCKAVLSMAAAPATPVAPTGSSPRTRVTSTEKLGSQDT